MRNVAHRLSEAQGARSRKALKFLGPTDFVGTEPSRAGGCDWPGAVGALGTATGRIPAGGAHTAAWLLVLPATNPENYIKAAAN